MGSSVTMARVRHPLLLLLLLSISAAAATTTTTATTSSAPLSPSSSSSPPGDSVYAGTSGFADLSAFNRVALLATVAVFLLLSVLSGRELYVQRYGNRRTSGGPVATGSHHQPLGSSSHNNLSGTAASSSQQPKHSYITPKHHYTTTSHGIPTPSTGSNAHARPTTGLLDDESGAALSTGAEMRQRFFVLLFAASTIRVMALVVQITTLRAMAKSPAASLYARLLSMFLWLPALLFVSMYGLVLLFWAQLCYACWGKFHQSWPRRLFFVFNVALYVVFVVLLLVTSTSGAFWRACDVLLGAIYLVGFAGILYYSVRLVQFFRNQGPDEEFFFDLPGGQAGATTHRQSPRQIVLRRITVVCVLLSVLFVAKAAYLVALGVGVVVSEETSQYRGRVGAHHIAFEFAMHFGTEFVPCALLLLLVTRKTHTSAAAAVPAGPSLLPQLSPATGLHSGQHQHQHLNPHQNPNYGYHNGNNLPPQFHQGLRGRNNSGHNSAFQDDAHSVGSGSLTGYQFQAVQRSYGTTLTNAVRSNTNTTATTPSMDSV